ncbi:ADP-ribosylglycohydrolase family protein [Streptomyces sp. NPDC051563]|uniref:ADP-ribosylglycohydrolase family protein n=1 Tax=Streptomyces sp. NPDC051563 TaxID=3365659 RepID=UPI0037B0A50E
MPGLAPLGGAPASTFGRGTRASGNAEPRTAPAHATPGPLAAPPHAPAHTAPSEARATPGTGASARAQEPTAGPQATPGPLTAPPGPWTASGTCATAGTTAPEAGPGPGTPARTTPQDAQPRTAAAAAAPLPQAAPGAAPAGPRRIEGLLLGLAAGDAAGWPAARHRASRMPEWTRRLTRELDTFAEQNATTTLPVPIALNQPPEPLRLGPSDDAEWAAFAAESVLTAAGVLLSDLSRSRRMRAAIDLAWNALASEVAAAAERAPEVESAVLPLRARISVRAGLGNLAAGLRPPATGHDNPHYFDDAACIRACVLAVVHPGDPGAAADLAEFDARYTQDGDGVHGARAMAAAIATALAGSGTCTASDTDAAVDAALAQLPESTEIGRNARHAVKLARAETAGGTGGAFAIVPLLEHQIVDHVYSYGIAAAETVPVALALATAARGRVGEAVPAAACLSRVADSAPALAGALTGALGGGDSLPAAWREACRTLSGCALPRLAGTDLVELAALLARTELTSPKTQGKPRT